MQCTVQWPDEREGKGEGGGGGGKPRGTMKAREPEMPNWNSKKDRGSDNGW